MKTFKQFINESYDYSYLKYLDIKFDFISRPSNLFYFLNEDIKIIYGKKFKITCFTDIDFDDDKIASNLKILFNDSKFVDTTAHTNYLYHTELFFNNTVHITESRDTSNEEYIEIFLNDCHIYDLEIRFDFSMDSVIDYVYIDDSYYKFSTTIFQYNKKTNVFRIVENPSISSNDFRYRLIKNNLDDIFKRNLDIF